LFLELFLEKRRYLNRATLLEKRRYFILFYFYFILFILFIYLVIYKSRVTFLHRWLPHRGNHRFFWRSAVICLETVQRFWRSTAISTAQPPPGVLWAKGLNSF